MKRKKLVTKAPKPPLSHREASVLYCPVHGMGGIATTKEYLLAFFVASGAQRCCPKVHRRLARVVLETEFASMTRALKMAKAIADEFIKVK